MKVAKFFASAGGRAATVSGESDVGAAEDVGIDRHDEPLSRLQGKRL